MRKSTGIFLMALLLSQGCTSSAGHRYFDYSGKDGCAPPNLGHRLGGDLPRYADNSIEGMLGIATQQDSVCFKNWEFDLSEWEGVVYLSHDPIESSAQSSDLVSLAEFQSAFQAVMTTKPIIIDLKQIHTDEAFKQVVSVVKDIREIHTPDVWFVVSPLNLGYWKKYAR